MWTSFIAHFNVFTQFIGSFFQILDTQLRIHNNDQLSENVDQHLS